MPEHTNSPALHKIRHDCKDLFRLKLLPKPGEQADTISWAMTPCAVLLPVEIPDELGHMDDGTEYTVHYAGPQPRWFVARHPYQLLALPDETEVLCPWPGQKKCDVFRFSIGEFRKAWNEAAKAAGEGSVTCSA